ncbi:MAG: hypothetical protein ACNS62_07585 [Candidatus Cyclobacteriaceae bacterium M3_2C_046]
MKTTCSFIFCTFIFILIQSPVWGQRYGTSLGLRFGNNEYYRSIGISGEQRLLKHLTIEAILQSDFSKNTTAHFLLKQHKPIFSKRFNYHYGIGLSTGTEESYIKDPESRQITHTYGNKTVGADLMVGLEMTILNTVISLDYKPNINITGREEFFRGQVGISARTVLVKIKDQKKKKRLKARIKRKKERQKRRNDQSSGNLLEGLKDLFGKK